MSPDLRIVFLFLLILTGLLIFFRRGFGIGLGDFFQIIIDFLLVLAVSGTVIVFYFLLTRTDPMPMLRNLSYQLSLQQLVSFEHVVPQHLQDTVATKNIVRMDTDGDNYKEWIVFYQFDLQNKVNPVQVMVYDNDRGNPPVIFPYGLRPPNRNYLGEGDVVVEMKDVTRDENGPNGEDLKEVLTQGLNELGIFRFRENSEVWDFPRDAPPRYQPIGFFRGSGGVSFDSEARNVTVFDRSGFERSQLVNRSVYAINPTTNTYWDKFYGPTELDRKLAAPAISTIDFFGAPPENILNTSFPEKIVLAFYASACNSKGNSLCLNYNVNWKTQEFLDSTGDAYTEYKSGNWAYFGLSDRITDISVSYLRYYPQLETDQDLQVTGGGRDVVTGEEAQRNVVDVIFTVTRGLNEISPEETARYAMTLVDGQWKISHRLPLDMPELGAPTTIPTNPE